MCICFIFVLCLRNKFIHGLCKEWSVSLVSRSSDALRLVIHVCALFRHWTGHATLTVWREAAHRQQHLCVLSVIVVTIWLSCSLIRTQLMHTSSDHMLNHDALYLHRQTHIQTFCFVFTSSTHGFCIHSWMSQFDIIFVSMSDFPANLSVRHYCRCLNLFCYAPIPLNRNGTEAQSEKEAPQLWKQFVLEH